MALSKTSQSVVSTISNLAAGTTVSLAFDTNYGVSGVAKITNAGIGPTIACDFIIEGSNDGGSNWFEWLRQTASTSTNTVSLFPFSLALGNGGDFNKYRVKFMGNTGQSVTVQCDAMTTATL